MMTKYTTQHFYDPETFTLTYLVFDEETRDAIVIDPVLNYNPASSKVSYESANEVLAWIKSKGLELKGILETHAHADHLSGSQVFKKEFPEAPIAIGKHITKVQKTFAELYNLTDLATDGSQFDLLLDEGKKVHFGSILVETLFTPGHTPADATFLIGDALYTGDTIFMPDMGTGRCDFPKGSVHDMYNSIANKLYELPDETIVYVGHDYQPGGRELAFKTTLKDQKEKNVQLRKGTEEEDFAYFREGRDKQLEAPRLLLPSIQVNIRAGKLPEAESNGLNYLKIPVTVS